MNKFLIVDDSVVARKFIERCFEINGCEEVSFIEAENGQKALEILKNDQFALVVSDLNMPMMGGDELLHKIKADPELQDIPVLLITSLENDFLRKIHIKNGAIDVLRKPISPSDLLPILQNLSLIEED